MEVKGYWCDDCQKTVLEDCGHGCFNHKYWLRDLTPGKTYWCRECDKIVSENCSHRYFGDEYFLRDMTPNKTYWCECRFKPKSQKPDGHGNVTQSDCECYGLKQNLRSSDPVQFYWC